MNNLFSPLDFFTGNQESKRGITKRMRPFC
uniref:Uncharacterized protein n=1 Tax=Rhizophora mucronata TaxID=61149 RepID=A0A2P2N7G8_RHIMU